MTHQVCVFIKQVNYLVTSSAYSHVYRWLQMIKYSLHLAKAVESANDFDFIVAEITPHLGLERLNIMYAAINVIELPIIHVVPDIRIVETCLYTPKVSL